MSNGKKRALEVEAVTESLTIEAGETEAAPVVETPVETVEQNASVDPATLVEAEAQAGEVSLDEADTSEQAPVAEASEAPKKRGGRKPMSAAEKEEAAKKRAEEKARAENMVPVLLLQYQGDEVDTAALIEAAKADFKAGHKRTLITDLTLYLKPEDRTAYYVINGSVSGSVSF